MSDNDIPPVEGPAPSTITDLSAAELHELTCPACRVIDRADGVEDGQLWKANHYASKPNAS